jgi:hypothetical protein
VSLGADCVVENSRIENSLIQHKTKLKNVHMEGGMIGAHCHIEGSAQDYSLGDYSTLINK